MKTMGSNKTVCLECKKLFGQEIDFTERHKSTCPDCGELLTSMPHRFRPPKKTDSKKWETVRFLAHNGFKFQHIYKDISQGRDGFINYSNHVPYPENLRDAKDFIEQYKEQAIKEE